VSGDVNNVGRISNPSSWGENGPIGNPSYEDTADRLEIRPTRTPRTDWKSVLPFAAVLLLLQASQAQGEPHLPAVLTDIGFDQRLNEQVPLDAKFKDESGRPVALGEYFQNKPVVLVLAYFKCPMLCTEVLNGLVRALLEMKLEPGRDFTILTVSFDSRETPQMATLKKKTYLERYGRPGAEQGWHFLTGQDAAIKRLTEAVGFRYRYDPRNDQFAHASGIMVLTPKGKISRYFYDVRYSARDLRLGLVEAADHRIGSPVDRILLYCFHYDPAEGRYGPVIMNFVRLGGILTLIGIGTFAGMLWRQERRKVRQVEQPR
jgi:protein SCO1/2